ncbi:MAG TPA: J domain-containing protein, partial [Thiobacillus sp.]
MRQALDQALAFWRAPALLANARHRPLPDDVLDVVRIAAGDSNAAGQGAEATGADPGELTEAAAFYLQQLLFAPGTDSYRVLGVNPGADDARIKEHYRWLVRWLHPDRNPDEWEALYADRVNRAWQDLRTPAKRAAYDASRDQFGRFAPEGAPTTATT